jgi:hypothetical protein
VPIWSVDGFRPPFLIEEWDFLTIYGLEKRIYKGSQEGGERHILTSQEGLEIWINIKRMTLDDSPN